MRLLYDAGGRPAGPVTDADLVGLYRWPAGDGGRPAIRSNFVASLDGSIQGLDGRSASINTPSDHRVFALHRALADAILVGAGTVRAERYRAVDLRPWQLDLRRAEGLAPYPTLVVISGSLRLDPALADPPYEHGPVIVLTAAERTDAELARFRDAGAQVLRSPAGHRIELAWVAEELVSRGLTRVLCEGGPTLHRDLIAAGLLDELSLTLAPYAVGGVGLRSTAGDPLPVRADHDLRLVLLSDDQTLFTGYRRRSATQRK